MPVPKTIQAAYDQAHAARPKAIAEARAAILGTFESSIAHTNSLSSRVVNSLENGLGDEAREAIEELRKLDSFPGLVEAYDQEYHAPVLVPTPLPTPEIPTVGYSQPVGEEPLPTPAAPGRSKKKK